MKITKFNALLLAAFLSIITLSCSAQQAERTESTSYLVSSIEEFDSTVTKLQPGDEIVLEDGTWTDAILKFTADGTQEKPITLKALNPGSMILSGSSKLYIGGDWLVVSGLCFVDGSVATSPTEKQYVVEFRYGDKEANNSSLVDCYFNNYSPQDKSFDDVWVNLFGIHNTVEHCYFGGKDNMGLYIVVWHKNGIEDHHRIARNIFHRPHTYNNYANGQEIIRIGDSANSTTDSFTTVENNLFYQCNGEIEIISIKSGNNSIVGNTFLECVGTVTLRHGNDNTVSGNYFISNGVSRSGGVRVINSGHKIYNNYFYGQVSDGTRAPISIQTGVENSPLNGYNRAENITIAANTFVDCKTTFSFGVTNSYKASDGSEIEATLAPRNVVIVGNIAVSSKPSARMIDDNKGTDISGISFVDTHLETPSGVIAGSGLINARYETETMKIAGVEVLKIVSLTEASLPDYITGDISGQSRQSTSPLGAIALSGKSPSEDVADFENCGPRWAYSAISLEE